MMHIQWDKNAPTVKGENVTITIHAGQTVGFSNAMEVLMLAYPQGYVRIRDEIRARVSDYAELEASGIPNVPEFAIINYKLPDDTIKSAVIMSVLEITAKDGKNRSGNFRTIIGNIDETEKLLTYFVPLEKLLA